MERFLFATELHIRICLCSKYPTNLVKYLHSPDYLLFDLVDNLVDKSVDSFTYAPIKPPNSSRCCVLRDGEVPKYLRHPALHLRDPRQS